MDRIISPYAGPGALPASRAGVHVAAHPVAASQPPKSAGDFLRAIRRRLPIVVLTTAIAGIAGAAFVVRMPPVFRASAQIQIEPPQYDPNLMVIVASGNVPTTGRESAERFVPNRLARLQGRGLAEYVMANSDLGPGKGYENDRAAEIVSNISSRRFSPGTNIYEVSLEGTDPTRITQLLRELLVKFADSVDSEGKDGIEKSKRSAKMNVDRLQQDLAKINKEITELTTKDAIFAPGNKNILHDEYVTQSSMLLNKKVRFDDLRHEQKIASLYPEIKGAAPASKYQRKIDYLTEMKERYEERLTQAVRLVRDPQNDPSTKQLTKLLDQTLDDLEKISQLEPAPNSLPDRSTIMLDRTADEIRKLEKDVKEKFDRVQKSMPSFQKYTSLMRERDLKESSISSMELRLSQFEMVSESLPPPVTINQEPVEPGGPVKPNRPMLIGAFTFLGAMIGIGFICFLEFLDRSLKVPEHLSAGLTLPILSVIPRIRRLARTQRGGHLWTGNQPAAIEADAYRNLRASLLGLTGPRGPIVSILVTSAKAGEGKSTTALNLALTCARAGERTLLMDVDLRRPSLAEVFDASEPNVGLVDVLRGDMPWQQAIVRTDVPNLNFLPTGDPSGVPIEVLGTLELRQLIAAVSSQYHRVILDGPAVLGLADCRMLGRLVDTSLLVVRSGTHELRPLRRAKEMLEQSRVSIAGVVFNGLAEDLDNWSSYTSIGNSREPTNRVLNSPVMATVATSDVEA